MHHKDLGLLKTQGWGWEALNGGTRDVGLVVTSFRGGKKELNKIV